MKSRITKLFFKRCGNGKCSAEKGSLHRSGPPYRMGSGGGDGDDDVGTEGPLPIFLSI